MRKRQILWGASWFVGLALSEDDYRWLVIEPDVFNAALESLRKQEQATRGES